VTNPVSGYVRLTQLRRLLVALGVSAFVQDYREGTRQPHVAAETGRP
jgi:hypothetical protein